MKKSEHLPTPATAQLIAKRIKFSSHLTDYDPNTRAEELAQSLGVSVHHLVLTQVLETENRSPLLLLVNADRKVSHAALARQAGCASVFPCTMERAQKHTGYMPGAISPFGISQTLHIYIEESVLALEHVYIGGGRRGYLLRMKPSELYKVLDMKVVTTTLPR